MSNLIKSSHVISIEDLKRIEQLRMATRPQIISNSVEDAEGNPSPDVETQSLKEQIIRDAELSAEAIVQAAREAADQIRRQAEEEANAWWQERRSQDAAAEEQARQAGYQDGFAHGTEEAGKQQREQWEQALQEANQVVRHAYAAKESIILEGEMFLVELSCRIAEKIIAAKVEETPELALKLIAKTLARRKEQGTIMLYVAPSQFAFVEASKSELDAVVDAQAILQIVPDASVAPGGCVIRSPFGSIDARIDTQLEAVREELLKVAAHAAEERVADGPGD